MTTCDNISIRFQLLRNKIFLPFFPCVSHLHATSCVVCCFCSQTFPRVNQRSMESLKKQQIFWIFWLNFYSAVMFDKFPVWGEKRSTATIVAHLCGRNCFRDSSLWHRLTHPMSAIDMVSKKGLICDHCDERRREIDNFCELRKMCCGMSSEIDVI